MRLSFIVIIALSLWFWAGSLSALDNPFQEGTETFHPPDKAHFGEELTAEVNRSFLEETLQRGAFRMEGLPLSDGRSVEVDLVQFSPYAADARIVVMTEEGPEEHLPPTDRRYFKGSLPFRPDSVALFVFWKGGFSGFVDTDGWRYIYGITQDEKGHQRAAVIRFDPTAAPETTWDCENDVKQGQTELPPLPVAPSGTARVPSDGTLKAELALDMDYEAYTYFGSVDNAANYATLLTAAISVFYERDANTIVAVKEITVWTSTGGAYPYTSTDRLTLLYAIQSYYINNKAGLVRASAHLLSRKSLGGGIAFLRQGGLLCDNNAAYGVDGIHGSYSYPTTAYTWDANCLAHELGHNFGSKHTHCYQDGGDWLDCCATETDCCQSQAWSRGTLMSYCHLGPYGIDMEFGYYVSPIIRLGAVNGSCVLESGSPGTFGGNSAYWSTEGLKVTKQTSPIPMSLILDNSSYGGAFGYQGTARMAMINKFTPTVYPIIINRIDILFASGTLSAGRAIQLLVYKDAAGTGNPANSTLAYTQSETIQIVSSSTWNSYTLATPQSVTSGDVYIGAYDGLADSADTYFASRDTGAALSRSYYKANSTTPSGYNQDTSRNYLIRAYGSRPPGGNDIILSWGDPCNAASQPGQKYAVYQDALSQLAVEGYDPSPLECAVNAQSYSLYQSGNAYFTVIPVVGPNEGGHGFSRPNPSTTCGSISPDPSCP